LGKHSIIRTVSDTLAQPATGLAHRLVGDPNSMIGALIKRGLTGQAVTSQVQPGVNSSPHATARTTPALDTLEQVLTEVEQTSQQPVVDTTGEGVMSQVMPQVMTQTADSLDPHKPMVATTQKEKVAPATTLEQVAVDAVGGVQQVEVEPTPEIPPEVESYLQKVEEQPETAPKEIVVADGMPTAPTDHQYPAQPVVVLPITQAEEQAGAKKSPKFSIRWLVEWSRKLMKMFVGKVIYRSVEGSAA